MSRWIDCDNKLPSAGKSVLCYDARFNKIFVGYIAQGKFIERDWVNADVTHWMLLPEAPEIVRGGDVQFDGPDYKHM